MYFPHAFRKSFLPSSQVAIASVSTATLGTTTGLVLAVSSATGIVVGQSVVAAGIPVGTIVSSISSTNITISQPITAAIAASTTINFGNGTATPTLSTALNAPNVLQFGTTAASTAGIVPGMTVTVSGVPAGTVVSSVNGGLVTLSNSVTATISTSTAVAFGASGVSVLTAGSTATLTAGQVGFFNPNGTAVQSVSAQPFIIAQGSYFNSDKISPALGGYKESVKTKTINPKYVSRVIKITAKQALQNVVQVPVTCGLACDSTYRLRVDVKGSPALRFLSHNMYRTLDSYTGCCSTVDPTLQKDPIPTLLAWKDQINNSLIFNTMVQARVYSYVTVLPATSTTTVTTTQATIPMSTTTGILVGQKVVGAVAWVPISGTTAGIGIPPNSFVSAVTSSTSIVIKFPTQQLAPTIGASVSMQFYSDLYSGAIDTPQAGTATVIPGTGTESGVGGSAVVSAGIATGATIATSASGALIYSPAADAASFSYTQAPHIELSAAYIETKFGICTFTPTDKYDLEPLLIYTSLTDESGDPCAVNCFTTSNSNTGTNTTANTATIVQPAVQASGSGETVLRDMILSDRYLQLAYPDSARVESLRMREIEQNPALASISRTSLYDQVMILHSVPRFNNPSGTFDNDQYLLVFNVPTGTSTVGLTNYVVGACAAAGNTVTLETY
jgi:hypothetical protein